MIVYSFFYLTSCLRNTLEEKETGIIRRQTFIFLMIKSIIKKHLVGEPFFVVLKKRRDLKVRG